MPAVAMASPAGTPTTFALIYSSQQRRHDASVLRRGSAGRSCSDRDTFRDFVPIVILLCHLDNHTRGQTTIG